MVAVARSGGLGGHPWWHLVAVVASPAVIIYGCKLYDRVRYRPRPEAAGWRHKGPVVDAIARRRRAGSVGRGLWLLAWLEGTAGVVHAGVCPEHFREGFALGLFFVVVSSTQLGWAAAVVTRPGRRLMAAGAALNGLVVVVWAWTRVIGVPLGADGGRAEAVGGLDVITTLIELAVVVGALRSILVRSPRPSLTELTV